MAEETIGIDITIQAAEGAKTVKELRQSIDALQDAALEAGNAGNDAMANKFVSAAGKAKNKLNELGNSIKDVATKGSSLNAVSGVANTLAGGFAAAQGAAAAS